MDSAADFDAEYRLGAAAQPAETASINVLLADGRARYQRHKPGIGGRAGGAVRPLGGGVWQSGGKDSLHQFGLSFG